MFPGDTHVFEVNEPHAHGRAESLACRCDNVSRVQSVGKIGIIYMLGPVLGIYIHSGLQTTQCRILPTDVKPVASANYED